MTGDLKLYLFGDQTFDLQPHLKELLQNRRNPILEQFLDQSYDAVRAEIFKLSRQARDDFPRFTCVDDLILWKKDGERLLPLDMALTCIYQLGMFISQADPIDFSADRARVSGLCTGALAAAAVACSRSTLDLVPLAVDAVVVAFRTGVRVTDVAHQIAGSEESRQSWSIIIPGSSSSDAVNQFCAQSVRTPRFHNLPIEN